MTPLVAAQLFNDPRLVEAKRFIREAFGEHQAKLSGVRPPSADFSANYHSTIEAFGQARGGNLLFSYIGSGVGAGALVELGDGSVKYDMIGGIGVHYFGHSHPALIEASIDAALRNTVMQGNLQQNAESHRLCRTLLDVANSSGAELAHCFLSTSGAMANENALKLAFANSNRADRVLAFDNCFMGRTITLAQITDRPAYRAGLPGSIAVDYLPYFDQNDPKGSTVRAIKVLEGHLSRHPGRYGLMCVELIQGEGGFNPGDRDFFLALFERLREPSIPILFDEVQTFGRTTSPFAFQHYQLDENADLVTIGKLTQVCATLFKTDLKPARGLLSQTFTGSSSSIWAAQCIIEMLLNGDHFGPDGRNASLHRHFAERLEAISKRRPGNVTGPFGIGGMIVFTAFDGSAEKTMKFIHGLFDNGVIAFVTGSKPLRVRFLPPMGILTKTDIDNVCRIVEQTLSEQEP